MRGGQEGPSKKLSALKWGSECTSSRQIPGGSIQQPPRRLPGLRCETRTCPLQALLCEGTEALLCEGTEGSWGAVPESQKSQAGMPHTAPPDLDFHSTQLPLPPAPRPLPQSGSLRGGGGRWEGGWKAARTPGAGPTPYHILPHPGRTVWQEGCFVSSLAGVRSSSQGGSSLGLQASMGGRGTA